jgi:hypothetical protein
VVHQKTNSKDWMGLTNSSLPPTLNTTNQESISTPTTVIVTPQPNTPPPLTMNNLTPQPPQNNEVTQTKTIIRSETLNVQSLSQGQSPNTTVSPPLASETPQKALTDPTLTPVLRLNQKDQLFLRDVLLFVLCFFFCRYFLCTPLHFRIHQSQCIS